MNEKVNIGGFFCGRRIVRFGFYADLLHEFSSSEFYTFLYEAVNAMLLNYFLKEHRKGQEQERKVAGLEATVAQQQKQIEALTATVQKVSNQVALSKPAPQLVANP